MTPSDQETPGAETPRAPGPCFVTTHWSVVVAAGRSDTPSAQAALEKLCRTYWYPLYAYVRRRGNSVEDAQDLTQEFFARLLEHHWVVKADRSKGRFRSFLLMAMKRFLAKEWEKARALKRGGGYRTLPIQLDTAETRYSLEPADTRTPEQVFERQWAVTLLASVLKRLREEYDREGKGEHFETLEPSLVGDREKQPYAALGAKLGMTEGAVRMAACRLREQYRQYLKEEIGHTVASAAEVEGELHHLFRVLARP
jgi:RNA polymerase sigma-70 factor (ECF subfamily)